MEISPAESSNLPIITKRLKEFYLNGSNVIKQSNDQGFLNVNNNFYTNCNSIDCQMLFAFVRNL